MDPKDAPPSATPPEGGPTYIDLASERCFEADALFDRALDLPPEERAAFLEEACGGDAALRRTVEELLRFADGEEGSGGGRFLEGAPPGLDGLLRQIAEDDLAASEGKLAGRLFGPWLLERELGRGGMGLVYLARHTETGKAAAVKLVPPAAASARLLERFEGERRALAKLPHAGIAGLLDGGVGEDGTPYFAMEYADGEAITAYCDGRRLGLRERLALFRQVCEAVQAAHQRLVVHRDLKPSNVFVVEEGGRPLVKLLDFGIAKVLADDRDEEGAVTATGERLMTPAYAAPEQVTGGVVTAATDVYALGVLLYELVTGRGPYRGDASGPAALAAVAEADVVRPSTAVARPSTAVARTARAGSAAEEGGVEEASAGPPAGLPERRRLAQRLRGDLDAILMRALRKEAEGRYPTAQALSDDLARYLASRPVMARRGSSGYRAAKYLRRHRLAVGAGLAVALALVVGLTLALWQARVASASAEESRLQAQRAEETLAFVLGLFERVSPEVAQGEAVTALELVEDGREQVEQLEREPLVQASVLATMGRLYHSLGAFPEADSLHRRALALRRSHLGPAHPDVAESMYDLADALLRRGSFEEAHDLYEGALRIREVALPPTDIRVLASLRALAFSHYGSRAYAAADSLYQIVLRRWAGPEWEAHPERALAVAAYGDVFLAKGEAAKAEALYEEALGVLKDALGEEHPEVADLHYRLARALMERDAAEAAGHFRDALSAYLRIYGERHSKVAMVRYTFATLREREGDASEAERLYRASAATYEQSLGREHPWSAYPLDMVGRLLLGEGRYAEAERDLRRAREIYLASGLEQGSGRVAAPIG